MKTAPPTRWFAGGWRRPATTAVLDAAPEYWALTAEQLLARLGSGPGGLPQAEAESRLLRLGPNRLGVGPSHSRARLLATQLKSPLVLLLVFAAIVSALTGEWLDAAIVLAIVVASVGVGYSREHSAQKAVAALQAQVQTKATVVRDGRPTTIPVEQIVPGDVAQLSAGCLVPGDARLLEAADLYVSEAALTGRASPWRRGRDRCPSRRPCGREPTASSSGRTCGAA